MKNDVKISSIQLSLIMIGFIFGSSAIINPATGAYQDAWLAFIIGWFGSYLLVGIYVFLSLLHPCKTIVDILKDCFGKFFGSLFAFGYIFYFIHLAALVLRNFGEYMNTVNYPETPLIFLLIALSIVTAFAVKNGLEVFTRVNEMLMPFVIIFVTILFLIFMNIYELKNLLPFLERGFTPVLQSGFAVLTFPFGETVIFLMIFPALNKRENLLKTAFIATTAGGLILLNITLRDLMALGPVLINKIIFPPHTTTGLLPHFVIDPFIAANLLINGGFKIIICLYAASLGITQLFGLDDYKPFVFPITAIAVSLSYWVYDSLPEMTRWAAEIYPYYAIPFQILIPLLSLLISIIKKKSFSHKSSQSS